MSVGQFLDRNSGWLALGGLVVTVVGFTILIPRSLAEDVQRATGTAPSPASRPAVSGWPWLDLQVGRTPQV